MKSIFILSIFMLISTTEIFAQSHNRPKSGNFDKFQIEVLIKQLEIEESKAADFKDIYSDYSDKLKSLRPKHRHDINNLSNEQIEAQILNSFKRAEQAVKIKEEFYPRFKKILTPRQILEMYNIERRLSERINSELQKRTKRGGNHAMSSSTKK